MDPMLEEGTDVQGDDTPEPVAEIAPPAPVPVKSAEPMRTLAVMKVKVGGKVKSVAFELYDEDAPITAENFARNVKDGLYKGLAFHRAIPGYLVQTGDPLTANNKSKADWGTGNPGFTIPSEFGLKHRRGSVAMARLGDSENPSRESNGSQFYFSLGNLSALDGKYTIFGEVVSGIEVLDEISRVDVDINDCPVDRIEVKAIRITETNNPAVSGAQETAGQNKPSRRGSKPDHEKGKVEKFIERVW